MFINPCHPSATIMYGRRRGKHRDPPPKNDLQPPMPGGVILPEGTDLEQVTVLSKAEWDRIEYALNRKRIEAEQLERKKKQHEEQKHRSREIVKSWGNTLAGQRQRKLEVRKQREEKEEAERLQIDIEEAELMAAQRKAAIEKAKTQMYYQTDRIKTFHSALLLTECMKERDAQIELKRLKKEAQETEDCEWLEMIRREYDEHVKHNQDLIKNRKTKAHQNSDFIQRQIAEHQKEQEQEKADDMAEGLELKKLSEAYQREHDRLEAIRAEERRQMRNDNKQQIQDVNKMKQLKEIWEEEENEECRIFASAKRKMQRMRAHREEELHYEKQKQLERIRAKLEAQHQQKMDDEDYRITAAQLEKEERQRKEDAALEAKRADMRKKIEEHRLKVLEEAEEKQRQQRQAELEHIEIRKVADELFRRTELERNENTSCEEQKRVVYLLEQMMERDQEAKNERQEQINMDKANLELLQKEEDQFQEYAKQVIDHCKKTGRNTKPLEKVAQKGAGGGLGPQFPGKGGVRPSYMVQEKSGHQLPCYQRTSTSNVKKMMHGPADSKERLGFVW